MKSKPMSLNALALALILSGGSAYADEAPLGRLFFSPAQRSSMDMERLTGVAGGGGGASVKVNGILRNRVSGKNTIWVNGTPLSGNEHLTGISPSRNNPAGARITTASGDPVEVRVGQITDRATGQNSAPLSDQSIIVHRKSRHGP